MTAYVNAAPAPSFSDAIAHAAKGVVAFFVENSEAMRCKREADRLFALSDAELARRGLTRDRVLHHAFARYLAS